MFDISNDPFTNLMIYNSCFNAPNIFIQISKENTDTGRVDGLTARKR